RGRGGGVRLLGLRLGGDGWQGQGAERQNGRGRDQGVTHPAHPLNFALTRLATLGGRNGSILPCSRAISLTSFEAMAWWRGSAIRNTVSISRLSCWFIAVIW